MNDKEHKMMKGLSAFTRYRRQSRVVMQHALASWKRQSQHHAWTKWRVDAKLSHANLLSDRMAINKWHHRELWWGMSKLAISVVKNNVRNEQHRALVSQALSHWRHTITRRHFHSWQMRIGGALLDDDILGNISAEPPENNVLTEHNSKSKSS